MAGKRFIGFDIRRKNLRWPDVGIVGNAIYSLVKKHYPLCETSMRSSCGCVLRKWRRLLWR